MSAPAGEPSLAGLIDHTYLKPAGDRDAIRRLCAEAKRARFASVCVNPCEVVRCARALRGSGVKVCTVIGFPHGAHETAIKVAEADLALRVR